jgi:hypothetical protein
MVNPPIMQFHGFWFCVSILDWYTLLVHPLFLVFLQWLYLLRTDSILEVRSRCLFTNEGYGLSRSTTLNMKPSCFTALYISLLTRNSISWGTIIHYLKFFSMRFILSWLQRGVLKPVRQLWPCCNWFMHMTGNSEGCWSQLTGTSTVKRNWWFEPPIHLWKCYMFLSMLCCHNIRALRKK